MPACHCSRAAIQDAHFCHNSVKIKERGSPKTKHPVRDYLAWLGTQSQTESRCITRNEPVSIRHTVGQDFIRERPHAIRELCRSRGQVQGIDGLL